MGRRTLITIRDVLVVLLCGVAELYFVAYLFLSYYGPAGSKDVEIAMDRPLHVSEGLCEDIPETATEPIMPASTDEQVAEASTDVYYEEPAAEVPYYSAEYLRQAGIIFDGDRTYTWYSENVLPGGGLDIEGRHVSDEGYVVDAYERIVVASADIPYGTEVAIPFGSGKGVVLDTGYLSPGQIDIYTSF